MSEKHKYITKQECIDALQDVLSDDDTTKKYYKKNKPDSYPSTTVISRRLGKWSDALELLGFQSNNKTYTKEIIVQKLEDASRALDKFNSSTYQKFCKDNSEYPSYQTVIKYFDGWSGAMSELDEESSSSEWTKQDVKNKLQEFYTDTSETTVSSYRDWSKERDTPSVTTIRNRFNGNWVQAVNKAGLPTSSKQASHSVWSKLDIINALQKFGNNDEFKNTYGGYKKFAGNHDVPSGRTIKTRFESWNEARDEAGIDSPTRDSTRTFSNEDILNILRLASEEQDYLSLERYKQMNKPNDWPCSQTIVNRFNGWKNALEQLGISTPYDSNYQENECIAAIQEISKKTDKSTISQVEYNSLKEEEHPSLQTIEESVFNSWNEAIEKAGINPNRAIRYETHSESDCIRAVKYVYQKLDPPPSMKEYRQKKKNNHPSRNYLKNHIGSWDEVLDKADIVSSLLQDDSKTSEYGSNWARKRFERVRKDDFECSICGLNSEESYNRYNMALHVHHIIKIQNFKTPEIGNHLSNLVTLCVKHHSKLENQKLSTQLRKLNREHIVVEKHQNSDIEDVDVEL